MTGFNGLRWHELAFLLPLQHQLLSGYYPSHFILIWLFQKLPEIIIKWASEFFVQDFSASLSFNGPSSLMAHNTTSQYGFQQQQSHSNSSGVPASYSNISQQQQQTSVQQNLPPQGPNSSANNPQVVTNNAPQGAPQNAQQSSNPAPFRLAG